MSALAAKAWTPTVFAVVVMVAVPFEKTRSVAPAVIVGPEYRNPYSYSLSGRPYVSLVAHLRIVGILKTRDFAPPLAATFTSLCATSSWEERRIGRGVRTNNWGQENATRSCVPYAINL